MKEFSSIESFRHVVKHVRENSKYHGRPLPTLAYTGTVKIHGTNAGVRVTHSDVRPQKRTSVVDIGSDNYGFAAFVHPNKEMFRCIAESFLGRKLKKLDDITFFGEWCGSGIQKNVAVANCEKHFVIFGAWLQRFGYVGINEITNKFDKHIIEDELNHAGIYFINQIPTYEIDIDFSDPESALQKMMDWTIEVETQCPWGTFRGVEGIGEGLVWVLTTDPSISDMWFKTKGLKHKNEGGVTKRIEIDPVKVASKKAFIEAVLPEWRLEQGISQITQDGLEIVPQSTGAYLKWICQDILKEEADVLTANGLCWKDVQGDVIREARQYFLTEVEKQAFT